MIVRLLAFLALAFACFGAAAQATWPVRPVKRVIPFPAGGPTDVMTRVLSEKLSQALGQPVVVENKPGTPRAVVERMNAEMNRILADAAVRERFHGLGFEVTGGTPAELMSVMQSEAQRWSKVIREANVKPE